MFVGSGIKDIRPVFGLLHALFSGAFFSILRYSCNLTSLLHSAAMGAATFSSDQLKECYERLQGDIFTV